jgi:tRNA splicing ligase
MKYPKTPYLPFSPTRSQKLERMFNSFHNIIGTPVIIGEKADGSNVFLSRETVHARSEETPSHYSFNMLKQIHATKRLDIPKNIGLFGEWCYATHTIKYDNLEDYLMVFSAIDLNKKVFLSWKEIESLCKLLGMVTVPKLFEGTLDSLKQLENFTPNINRDYEGYVIRNAKQFTEKDFEYNIAKWVKPKFISGVHWTKNNQERNNVKRS